MLGPGGAARTPGSGTIPAGVTEAFVAPAAIAALGVGAIMAAAGAAAPQPALLVAGGAVAAAALVLLLAGGWLDALMVLVVSLPLPALVESEAFRLAPAAPVTALVVAAWLLAWGPSGRRWPALDLPAAGLGAFLGAYLLAALFTEHRAAAAREIVNLLLLGSLLFVLADHGQQRRRPGERVAAAAALVAGVCGVLAVLEMLGVLPARFPEPNGLNRAALGFGQPNGLGMFLALCVPLVAHARSIARNPVSRAASAVALAAVVAGLMATLSRGSALSVLAGALILPLAGQWRTALKIWGGALLAAVAGDMATGGVVRETVMGALTDWSVAQRAALMLSGVRLFLEHPLVGIGPGAFAHELERAGVLVPTLQDLKPTPHNAYIQVAAETGLLGLVTLLILCAAVLRRLLRSAREEGLPPREKSLRVALLWGFGIVLAEGMVEWPLSHGHGQLVVLVVALGCTRRAAMDLWRRHDGGGRA